MGWAASTLICACHRSRFRARTTQGRGSNMFPAQPGARSPPRRAVKPRRAVSGYSLPAFQRLPCHLPWLGQSAHLPCDVLKQVIGFLNTNPTETVILSVKEESSASGNSQSFETTFNYHVAANAGQWCLSTQLPALKGVRG